MAAGRRADGGNVIILGVDPGLAIVGYGVVDYRPGGVFRVVDYGCIFTEAHTPLPKRLIRVYDGMQQLIDTYQPEAIAMEELFFNKNVKTALMVAQARGTALTCAAKNTQELYEYTPLQVKQAVVGYGRADKHQVQTMVQRLLGLSEIPKPDDAADALAIAICHANSCEMPQSFRIE